MKCGTVLLFVFATVSLAPAAETLFCSGLQEFEGTSYYWLAEWKLEVTLPEDVAADDRFEVLFGSKGPAKRTMHYQYDGRSGSLTDVRKQPFEWIAIPLGKSTGELKVKPRRIAVISSTTQHAATWADLSGFEMNGQTRSLWDPSPQEPDWKRAERSSQYAGIALGKAQRWLHECCLPVRDDLTQQNSTSAELHRPIHRLLLPDGRRVIDLTPRTLCEVNLRGFIGVAVRTGPPTRQATVRDARCEDRRFPTHSAAI